MRMILPNLASRICKGFSTSMVLSSILFGIPASADGAENDKEVIEVFVNPFNKVTYERMIEGYDIFDLGSWKNMALERHTLEILIFNVAPVIGGCDCEVVIKEYSVDTPHARSIEQVRSGRELSHPVAMFSGDSRVVDGFHISEPILDAEDFYVGLYTHADRVEILALTSEEKIRDLDYVVGRSWEIDNKILDDLSLNKIAADNWKSVIFMLIDGRADVVMQPFFATQDLGFTEVNGTEKYLPIPNVKMRFEQDRVFAVSKKHPQGADFIHHLNKGLTTMKSDDEFLKKAHVWAGVINQDTIDHKILFEEN